MTTQLASVDTPRPVVERLECGGPCRWCRAPIIRFTANPARWPAAWPSKWAHTDSVRECRNRYGELLATVAEPRPLPIVPSAQKRARRWQALRPGRRGGR